MDVQLLGLPKSRPTRAAKRFLSERRVPFHDLDLRRHGLTPGELRKWVQRFGAEACLDTGSRAFVDQGLRHLSASDEDWTARMAADPTLIALPLVRAGKELAVGDDPAGWQRIVDAVRG